MFQSQVAGQVTQSEALGSRFTFSWYLLCTLFALGLH